MREDGRELIKSEELAGKEFKCRRMTTIKEASEQLNMVILDVQFKGLGKRAMEILKQAPMNR